jgi:hypothetical protein
VLDQDGVATRCQCAWRLIGLPVRRAKLIQRASDHGPQRFVCALSCPLSFPLDQRGILEWMVQQG